MPKNVKSQWDFGELFPPEATRRVWSVSELTSSIKGLLEGQVGLVWVAGEISNLRVQSSGHIYFTLKDAGAQVNCVLFRGTAAVNRELLADGRKATLQGDLTVYEPRGQYQLVVRAVELQGAGALQLAFERLKQKLQAEGLFAPEHKRPLPRYPQRIGIVTSPTGAALQDVRRVVQRRHPGLELVLAPARVQGDGAGAEIAAAIGLLNEWSAARADAARDGLDLILVTRGGGSLEDLWAFNEEIVARAIFESALPVVSAVGHEIDFTISDFVADLRAATPSAAAEIITEGAFASRQVIAQAAARLGQLTRQKFGREEDFWRRLCQRLARAHPRRHLNEKLQRLDDLETSLGHRMKARCRDGRAAWSSLAQRLLRVRPSQALAHRRDDLREMARRLPEAAQRVWRDHQNRWAHADARLRLLSPLSVLDRGYSITTDAVSGRVIRSVTDVRPGQRLATRVQTGEIHSVVEDAGPPTWD